MTIRDMHIEVNQSLQKVAANKTRKYFDSEIDWVLNKMQDIFITSKLKPRPNGSFEVNQLDLDAVRPAIKQVRLPVYLDDLLPNRYKCFLPGDYKFLIADGSVITDTCVTPAEEDILSRTSIIITLTKSNKTTAPFYQTLTLEVGNKTLNIPGDLPYGHKYTGYESKDDIDFLIPWIIYQLNEMGYNAGYETNGDVTVPNSIIINTVAAFITKLTIDGSDLTNKTYKNKTEKMHKGSDKERLRPNRLIASEHGLGKFDIPFYKSGKTAPISELIQNTLYIERTDNFTVNSSIVTYIRKLKPMSLALNSSCELVGFEQDICDLAVAYIKNRIENGQGYNLVDKDNKERVIL